jgi:hypothetical protein
VNDVQKCPVRVCRQLAKSGYDGYPHQFRPEKPTVRLVLTAL